MTAHAFDLTQRYSADDYFGWPDEPRCELIHGEIYLMSTAPVIAHQRAVKRLTMLIEQQCSEKSGGPNDPCEVLFSPIDVKLSANSVVQPDLVVVCDPQKLMNGRYVDGAPELVAEVLSPSTALKDRREKRDLYAHSGVAEYLLVDPTNQYVELYRLGEDGGYGEPQLWGPADRLQLSLFPGLEISLAELFEWPLAEEEKSAD